MALGTGKYDDILSAVCCFPFKAAGEFRTNMDGIDAAFKKTLV